MKNTVQALKALSDECRLRILGLLLNSGELCVCDITDALLLPQSTVSRHLSYLKNAGWISDRREGVWIYYRLAAEGNLQREMAALLKEFLPGLGPVAADLARLAALGKGSGCK
jgi:ArsR family transcriptional regulator